jgi:CheY-like chemotaxis protein
MNVGVLRPGRWVCLSVIDTGVGLEAKTVDSIFEPFYTTREAGKGSGIGLSVVRNIVSRMGGAIGVTSRHGAGTTVSVFLPRPDPDAESLLASPADLRQQGRGESVMIVDDEPELVSLVEELLASMGYEPVGFTDVRLALEAFRRDPARFDLLLTDERMPVMRGVEFSGMIRGIDSQIPIIMMTGHHDADLDALAMRTGIAEILDKPVRAQALQSALERRLRHRAIAAETTPAAGEMTP